MATECTCCKKKPASNESTILCKERGGRENKWQEAKLWIRLRTEKEDVQEGKCDCQMRCAVERYASSVFTAR